MSLWERLPVILWVTLIAMQLCLVVSLPAVSDSVAKNEIYVPKDYKTISDAVKHATNNTVIYVLSGTYEENVRIVSFDSLAIVASKGVVLYGSVSIVSSHNISIKNLNIYIVPYGSEPGVLITDSDEVVLSNVSLYGSGIFISSSQEVRISASEFSHSPSPALFIEYSKYVMVLGSKFSDVYSVSNILNSSNIVFRQNTVISVKSSLMKIFRASKDIAIYANNFLGDTKDIICNGENISWFSRRLKLGNYWRQFAMLDEYQDKNKDGILDKPVRVCDDEYDEYPLANSWEHYSSKLRNNGEGVSMMLRVLFLAVAVILASVVMGYVYLKRRKG